MPRFLWFFTKTLILNDLNLKFCKSLLAPARLCSHAKSSSSEDEAAEECRHDDEHCNSISCSRSGDDEEFPEPQLINLETPEDIRKKVMSRCKIIIREHVTQELINGRPMEVTRTRVARIFQPTKNAQQQGTRHLGHWLIDFDTKKRWENPLMGWCSSGDPISNLNIHFSTKEEAVAFCEKNKLSYWVQESKTHKKFRVKSYAVNFHYNQRTRVSTK